MTIIPSRDEFQALANHGNLISLALDLVADVKMPVSTFAKLQNVSPE